MIDTADPLGDIETPVALIDLHRVRENASRAAAYTAQHGLAWRPHIKTHKSLAIARIQLDAGARGLTVATPHEAEVMSAPDGRSLDRLPALGTEEADTVDVPTA